MAESTSEALEKILTEEQGSSLTTNICEKIIKVLNHDNIAKLQSFQKLLEICIQNPKDDIKYTTETFNIVSIILKKITAETFTSELDLLPSMLEILRMLNTSIYSFTSDQIKVFYFKILILFPEEVYLKLDEVNEVLELFNLYVHQRIPIELRVQPINVLHKYLKVLPPDKRSKFVEQGINIWLLKLVPSVMLLATKPDFEIETSIATLEMVVNEFHHFDYFDNPNWQSILQCLYEPKKYPNVMMNLLAKSNDVWCRLWIVFIKMLKNQLTKSGSSGSPINSMLPVVETAFKMDVTNRCRAFHCWDALIDNFATETNEAYVNKRIKLLVIPLYSNNAKVEETVIAKINTWWHLICSYHSKLSNFAEMILIPFLQFCFGRSIASNKSTHIQGALTNKTKEYCVEAFVNIFGHHNCDGCVSLPASKHKIINEKCLLASKKDLVYSLSEAIKIVTNNDSTLRLPYKCAWISFIKLICDMPNEGVRRDLFNELLVVLENLIQDIHDETLNDIILNDLIITLFKDDGQIMKLLNPTDGQDNLMNKILSLTLNPSFDTMYNRNDMSKIVENFKPFTDFIVEHCFQISIVNIYLNRLSANYKSLVLWTAMTSSICEKKCDSDSNILSKVLKWPLEHLEIFTKVEFSTSLWFALFEFMNTILSTQSGNEEIVDVIKGIDNINANNYSFLLNVSIMLLNQKITADKGVEYEKEARLVYDILNKFQGLNGISVTHPIFSKVMDTLLQLLKNLLKEINLNIAKQVFMILQLVLTLVQLEIKKSTKLTEEFVMKVDDVLKSVEDLLKLKPYESLKQVVLAEFLEYAQCFGQQQSLKVTILDILQMFLDSMDEDNPSINVIKDIITSVKENMNSTIPDDISKFTTPTIKKTKKKETSIVNTVVEDGEEFVVVKSNWKFNPKKLTDNQKEKLKRKREDIPALYQDLSQSQDEFKLSTWKTDSQDTTTTTTNSKSNDLTTSEKVSSILKNMPNMDVVPKILKNILTENNEKVNSNYESTNERNNETQTPTNKEVKPRLSLKDRVFRNVRNLIEKSDVQDKEKHVKSVMDEIAPQCQTPTEMKIKITGTNSAPLELNADRPSRVKRKPKKFEEMQIFALKKRRHSCNSESQNKDSVEDLIQSKDIKENSEDGEINLNPSDIVSQSQENQNTLVSNMVEDANYIDVQNKKKLSIDNEILAQDVNIDNHQHKSKSNDCEAIPPIDEENNVVIYNSTVDIIDKIRTNNDNVEKKENSSVQTPLNKKPSKKKSRIEKELAIDMVEGHPFLKIQSEKRLTRKKASESPVLSRRKSLTRKLNTSKGDQKNMPNVGRKIKGIENSLHNEKQTDNFPDSQESSFQDENGSQDIIESSQDSTVSIMSVKSSKIVKRIPVIALENIQPKITPDNINQSSKGLRADSTSVNDSVIFGSKNNDDSEFPLNKTATEHVQIDLTENQDTEPIESISSNEVIVINDEVEPPVSINLDGTYIDMDTQDIADADTQPMDLNTVTTEETKAVVDEIKILDADKFQEPKIDSTSDNDTSTMHTQEEITRSLTESLLCAMETKPDETLLKPSMKDEEQRKQDFLNNTLEISPIKTLSPVRKNQSPSPDTSSDYVVIKLSSPVQSNGEPFQKCDSPEVFTEEKVSPDKRDQSPPREEPRAVTASPRSLSLKKNKPQVRPGGRAAQMLGLCIPGPDRLQPKLNLEKSVEPEEPKKSSPLNSSARRNLRILYNSTNESSDTSGEGEESKNFLKMKRSLPAADSSPSVPILKRKLADIVDDTTTSPANKRKRVSFHDPPVSTTVCVKKYIESSSVRSPQNSATKRQERQSRSQLSINLKSQKSLDTVFKLDTALTKAVESFSDADVTPNATEDTEMSSLEPTPLVEVVKNSELNDVDPICLDLINCEDPVDNIAGDLSSSAMRPLLVKEFAGKIETVGDLAKLSELEVNRLCIKAPKVQVAKNVLTEYAKKIKTIANEMTPMTEAAFSESTVLEPKAIDVEIQTNSVVTESIEVQTEALAMSLASTQTNIVSTMDCDAQTDESGSKSTEDIAISLLQKSDYCERLKELLDVPSKQSIATSLPLSVLTDTVLQEIANDTPNSNLKLSFMRDYLSKNFSPKDLILLCSDLLKIYANNI